MSFEPMLTAFKVASGYAPGTTKAQDNTTFQAQPEQDNSFIIRYVLLISTLKLSQIIIV